MSAVVYSSSIVSTVPPLTTLARNKLSPNDFTRFCWTPIGPRIDRPHVLSRSPLSYFTPLGIDKKVVPHLPRLKEISKQMLESDVQEQFDFERITAKVFVYKEFPDLFFKLESSSSALSTRVNNIAVLNKMKKQYHLACLELPVAYFFGDEYCFVAEQHVQCLANTPSLQKEAWEYCLREPHLRKKMQEFIKQLTILICKTGLSNIRPENVPLLADMTGCALVSISNTQNAMQGIKQLIEMVTEDYFDCIVNMASLHLPTALHRSFDFSNYFQARREALQQENVWDQFLIKKGISTGYEPLLMPCDVFAENDTKELCQQVLDLINEKLQKEEKSLSIKDHRTLYISLSGPKFSRFQTSILNKVEHVFAKLQQYNAIFSFRTTEFRNFYLIKC